MSPSVVPHIHRRLPLAKISAVAQASVETEYHDLGERPIERSRYFVCPTTTPLYYTQVYSQLTTFQQLRYNQLTAIGFSELISYFESEFAASVCAALAEAEHVNDCLRECLQRFVSDERHHIEIWNRLSRLSEPDWYRDSDYMLIHVAPVLGTFLRCLTRRPHWFPVVYWIMLLLEERSLDLSRRCLKMDEQQIEPHYRRVYREHLKDELRHVQIDWHLIDLYYSCQSTLLRTCNARLLQVAISRFLLPPTRSAIRIVRRLVEECPDLAERQSDMELQLRALSRNAAYHQMMYSRETTPIAFGLFDRFPEMHRLQKTLLSYSVVSG